MQFKNDPNNVGYIAEKCFYDLLCMSKDLFIDIKSEADLKKEHGVSMASIDYLLIRPNGIIPIQIKYRGSRRKETIGITNFILSVDKLCTLYDKPILFGCWVSRLRPFLDNESKLKQYKVKCVDEYDNMNLLMEKSIDYIVKHI